MEYIVKAVDKAESILPMDGALAIPARFAIGAAIGWLVWAAASPGISYNSDGSKRPFLPVPELYEGRGPPTLVPWIAGPLIGGLLFTTLI